MNPKRPVSKNIRVDAELYEWVTNLAASYGVAKRDAIDAVIRNFKEVTK